MRQILFLIVSFTLSQSCCAQDSQQQTVEKLIEQLRSPQREQRLRASEQLIELGSDTIDILQSKQNLGSATTFQIQQIQATIRKRLANETLLGATISFAERDGVTLQQAATHVQSVVGYSAEVDASLANLLCIPPSGEASFWEVIDELGRTADAGWLRTPTGVAFRANALKKLGSTAYPQCLRVAAAHRVRQQTFRRRGGKQLVRISFRVDAEPAIVPFFITVRDQDFKLSSDTGETFTPFNPSATREVPVFGNPWFEFAVDFQTAEELTAQEFGVYGELELFCAARSRPITVSLSDPQASDDRVTVRTVDVGTSQIAVVAKIFLPEVTRQLDSHRLTLLHQHAELKRGDETIRCTQKRIVNMTQDAHEVEFIFKLPTTGGEQGEFIYHYPELLTHLPVGFEISSIRR